MGDIHTQLLTRTLMNLTTLGEIQRGTKLSTTKDFIVVTDQNMFSGISRMYANDSREKAVKTISREVYTAIALSVGIMESRHLIEGARSELKKQRIDRLRDIRQALLLADKGIAVLCSTYIDDANTTIPLRDVSANIAAHFTILDQLLEIV